MYSSDALMIHTVKRGTRSPILSALQRDTFEALVALGEPSTVAQVLAYLAGMGVVHEYPKVSVSLSMLALHDLVRIAGHVPFSTPDGRAEMRILWARTSTPAVLRTRYVGDKSAKIRAALEHGPMPLGALCRITKVRSDDLVREAQAYDDIYIIRAGWRAPRPVVADQVKRARTILGLHTHYDQMIDALAAHITRSNTRPRRPKADPSAPSKADKPAPPPPPPAPAGVLQPAIAPAPQPPPPSARGEGFLTPDMTAAQRIAAIRERHLRLRARTS